MTSHARPLPAFAALLLPASLALGGCVVGGTSAVPFSTTTRVASAETMASRLQDMTPTTTMPTASTASYRGYLAADATLPGRDDPLALLGTMRLTADFGASQIDGNFASVIAEDGTEVSGSGSVTGGTITGAAFGADIAGSLVADDSTYAIDGSISGEFVGPDAGGIRGETSGDVLDGAATVGSFTGTFGLR
ncbi:MAG: hypothetical protein HKN63_09980 [Rhodobacteraceae bacterium]|nr:hypothetical protein [Paracoccaceae bacterium]